MKYIRGFRVIDSLSDEEIQDVYAYNTGEGWVERRVPSLDPVPKGAKVTMIHHDWVVIRERRPFRVELKDDVEVCPVCGAERTAPRDANE